MPAQTRRLHILLVEDHADTAHAVARLLANERYVVHCAADGAEALRAAGRARFDLLICDLCLPDIDGCEVMQRLKAQFGMAGIAISGRAEAEQMARALDAGFAHYLVKPIEWQSLKALVGGIGALGND